jgi:hypothetical protein
MATIMDHSWVRTSTYVHTCTCLYIHTSCFRLSPLFQRFLFAFHHASLVEIKMIIFTRFYDLLQHISIYYNHGRHHYLLSHRLFIAIVNRIYLCRYNKTTKAFFTWTNGYGKVWEENLRKMQKVELVHVWFARNFLEFCIVCLQLMAFKQLPTVVNSWFSPNDDSLTLTAPRMG